jgi:hypothetical protein
MNHYVVLAFVATVLSAPVAHAAAGSICTSEYAPVCASHQVECIKAPCYPVYQTYGNSCLMTRDNSTYLHSGTCTVNELGPIKPPVPPFVVPKNCTAWFDGCNFCSITPNKGTICTMRACSLELNEPGKCTAYSTTKPPSTKGGGTGVVHSGSGGIATSVPAVVPTSTPPLPEKRGLFGSIWSWLTGWFR